MARTKVVVRAADWGFSIGCQADGTFVVRDDEEREQMETFDTEKEARAFLRECCKERESSELNAWYDRAAM